MGRLRAPISLALVVALAGCEASSARRDEGLVRTPGGFQLHYARVRDGAPVLLVPEASVLATDLEPLARGRTAIFYDPRGRGRSSEAGRRRLEDDVADLEAVRAELGLESFALLGARYGAVVAARYAARHPERVEALVLVSPLPIRRDPHWPVLRRAYDERLDEQALEELERLRRDRAARSEPERWRRAYLDMALGGLVADPGALERIESPWVVEGRDPELEIRAYLDLLESLGEWDWRDELAGIACPTLIVRGSADPMPEAAYGEWAAALPAATLHAIEGSGRLPWIEREREFFAAVGGFLEDTRRRSKEGPEPR